MVLPGPLALARRLLGSASFRIGALTSLGLLGAWVAQTSGAVQDLELHKFSEVRGRPTARNVPSAQVGGGWCVLGLVGLRRPPMPRRTLSCTRSAKVHVQTGQVLLGLRVSHSLDGGWALQIPLFRTSSAVQEGSGQDRKLA